MGSKAKRKIGETDERSALSELAFCLSPTPHLGTCSQVTRGLNSSLKIKRTHSNGTDVAYNCRIEFCSSLRAKMVHC